MTLLDTRFQAGRVVGDTYREPSGVLKELVASGAGDVWIIVTEADSVVSGLTMQVEQSADFTAAVSYTHLTLPTKA